ncbi:FecR family protein [Pedobacter sp. AJM]|uniref:FecR family protein n=1 Tax=Pedobacter sp. AJM TaxID=2003629 RepID=UPI000B4AD270|nr:FecR family protein [Pedobacter sp. AJM]OWK69002.1 hypothetical protein CBW18_19080 [Pedobacter sp. AJM]
MEDYRIIYLYQRFTAKLATRTEVEELDAYLENPESHQHLMRLLENEFMLRENPSNEINPASKERIFNEVIAQPQEHKMKLFKLWSRIAIAASVTVLIFGAGLFYFENNTSTRRDEPAYTSDVKPGIQGATLTLANGKKVKLTSAANGKITEESGVLIRKDAEGQLIYEVKETTGMGISFNTLSTSKGQTYRVQLPDGSMVWLNAASSLTYPTSFASLKERRVSLSGEAYLEVAKDKLHPFILESKGQEIKVLGTHFNVNSYADEPATTTTLLEGSVQLSSGRKTVLLHPGEQSLNAISGINVSKASDIESVTDWKDGDFNLDDVELRTVMRKIARWYDVEVVYSEGVSNNIRSVGMISRNKQLSSVLGIIEASGQVKFRIEGKKVYVSK